MICGGTNLRWPKVNACLLEVLTSGLETILLQWAYRERIRTLLAGLSETDLCFAEETVNMK